MLIDLQVHSTYSDGYLTPTEVVGFLSKQGVKVASLTDHNTVGGIEEFKKACLKAQIKPIVGIELYTRLNRKEYNLLWYNFDHTSPELHEILRQSQASRRGRTRTILEILVSKSFKININKVLDKYNHYISINHLIDDILAVPFNRKRIKEDLGVRHPREEDIIKYYFYNSKRPKFSNSHINTKRIFDLRKKIGGQIIFNHPGKYNQLKQAIIENLKRMGIDGIEVMSPHHSVGAIMYAQFLANEMNLIMTGGSDFHRFERDGLANLKSSWDYFKIDANRLNKIEKIIG
ncbi:PHP domain-containing protein [Candidatus Falkowbacteria bacterium]|nr:PHP domain-containing protein [Candidatus Falkowbacteria bacterium]